MQRSCTALLDAYSHVEKLCRVAHLKECVKNSIGTDTDTLLSPVADDGNLQIPINDIELHFPIAAQMRLLLLTPEEVPLLNVWFGIHWRNMHILGLLCCT